MEVVDTAEEIARLQSALDEAYALIESRDSDLHLSATYGRRLLEDNAELSRKYEALSTELSAKIEVCVVLLAGLALLH